MRFVAINHVSIIEIIQIKFSQTLIFIIPGASSGIGAATAVEFARVGAKVVLTARRRDRLEETAEKCRQAGLDGSKVLVVTADIMEDADLQRIIHTTVRGFGGVNVLVNNAGEGCFTNMATSTAEDMDRMYRMHVRAPYLLIKLALPHLLRRKGCVVNVSSVASPRPVSSLLPYSVAKCAQDQMMKAAALELGKDGVRLNSVCPGSILTEVFANRGYTDKESLNKVIGELAVLHPLKRIGEPEEVAKAIVFLASDDASFVSGVDMPVDGGRSITSWIPASRM